MQSCGTDDTDDSSDDDDSGTVDCEQYEVIDGPGTCNTTLDIAPEFLILIEGENRVITANNIPEHMVGTFPNADVSAQDERYTITTSPEETGNLISLQSDTGPVYRFGILLNGVELDPIAAEPWPHSDLGIMDPDVNWNWNLEALNVRIGLDCNYGHVQPTGQYHYHGAATLYDLIANADGSEMVHIGWAADGFPIYYKYAYSTADDSSSEVVAMSSSYELKEGDRPGDGVTAPCSEYNGAYAADFEYIEGQGTLDEANGRTGVTPEFPEGTYYYILTDGDEFPSIPRYFVGTPSDDFTLGGGNGGPN
ncbi:hypothetical protein GCM10022393_09670 [Aquimarina addita]|uniref:YHYH domain-containing protein n=1 Tax=Aquimarina addita TaxID=870485 RepID=A0ABP7XDD9_9FLAO